MGYVLSTTNAPTEDTEGMLKLFKQQLGGLLSKVPSGMFTLCPAPANYGVIHKEWIMMAHNIVVEAVGEGDSLIVTWQIPQKGYHANADHCLRSYGDVHFF